MGPTCWHWIRTFPSWGGRHRALRKKNYIGDCGESHARLCETGSRALHHKASILSRLAGSALIFTGSNEAARFGRLMSIGNGRNKTFPESNTRSRKTVRSSESPAHHSKTLVFGTDKLPSGASLNQHLAGGIL